jgi:competence protein ComEA
MVERIIAGAWLLATTIAQAQPDKDTEAFGKVCGACHAATMVTDLRTEPDWAETVQHMISLGAKGTPEELDRVLGYLASNLTIVNVNTAEPAQIAPVLAISDSTAQSVVEYRSRHGNFKTLDDLKKVPGLNPTVLDARKKRIVF